MEEKDILQILMNFLLEKGYPAESFFTNYKIGNTRVDLVVVDPYTNIPLQIFEIKSKKTEQI